MHMSKPTPAPIVKGYSFGKHQCPKNKYELEQMKAVPLLQLSEAYSMHKCAHALT